MRPLSRRAAVVTAASAAVATLLSPTLAGSAGAVPSPAAGSADAGSVRAAASGWTAVSGPVDSTTTPAFLRGAAPSPSKTPLLRLLWPQRDSDGTWSIRGRVVITGGGAGASTTVLSGWHDLNTRVAAVNSACGQPGTWRQHLLFAGNRTTDTTDPLSQGVVYGADSDGGASWSVDTTGSYSSTRQAVSTYGLGAAETDACDRVLAAFTTSSSTHASFHVGPEAGIPAPTEDGATADTGSGVRNVTVGVSSPGISVWVVWSSYGSSAAEAGVHAQRVLPSLGPVLTAPGSARADGTVALDGQPVGVASAGDGSLWVAYRDAANSKAVRLWQAGTSTVRVIPGAYDVERVTLTSSARGVLWAAIVDAAGTRANPSLRALRIRGGCTTSTAVPVPAIKGRYTNVWQIGAAPQTRGSARVPGAAGEALHLWLNASIGSDDRLWYASVLPSLHASVTTKPSPLRAGTKGLVTVKVTETCLPMNGVKVGFLGTLVTTNASGVATFSVPKSTAKGVYKLVAAAPGYEPDVVKIRVR